MEAAGKRYIIHGSRKDEFKIWNFADVHLISAACAEKLLDRDIQRVKDDPLAFWLGGGDLADYIGYADTKRFDPQTLSPKVSVSDLGRLGEISARMTRDKFAPIKDKCLGICMGNHEYEYYRRNQQNGLHGWLCTELGVPNLGYSALLDLVFCRTGRTRKPFISLDSPEGTSYHSSTFRVYIHHGAGAATTHGGKMNRLSQFMTDFEADIYFIGHVHDRKALPIERIGADAPCRTITARKSLGVISGAYVKTYAQGLMTWGERKAFRPSILGAAWVRVNPETRDVTAEV